MTRGPLAGLVREIAPESPAAVAGLRPGDVLVTAEGHPLRDEIDWRWYADGPSAVVGLADGSSLVLEREPGQPWGVSFESPVFDYIRTCENRCGFCFMAQLPPGMRPALTLRDDDFRLSFMSGNFITLTNIGDEDVARIVEQRLSPLYVSLHAVDPAIRERLLCARSDRALSRFDELVANGIELHTQLVLVPGVNDGEQLDRTLAWLAERDCVASIGIVPVGYTAHQDRVVRSFEAADEALAVVSQVQRWRDAFLARDGSRTVHLADELYLAAGVEVPPASHYEGFPQIENGIGMVRHFLDQAAAAPPVGDRRLTLLTGELFAPVLARWAPGARVLGVANGFFGGNVSVAGLLTSRDVVDAIREDGARGEYVLPDVMFNEEGLTLDDVPSADLGAMSGAHVSVVSSDAKGAREAVARTFHR